MIFVYKAVVLNKLNISKKTFAEFLNLHIKKINDI